MSCDAMRELLELGVCEIRGAISLEWVKNARDFVAAMKPCVKYGGLRCELSFASTEAAFDWHALIAGNDVLAAVLKGALGPDYKLLRVGGIM